MIRKAKREDIGKIMEIVREAIALMNGEGNTQWDQSYPLPEDFFRDMDEGTLYVYDDGEVRGFVCINWEQPPEYEPVAWKSDREATVIHRMAISEQSRGQGIAKLFMGYAEQIAQENGENYIRTDTNSMNTRMNEMFRKLGYTKAG